MSFVGLCSHLIACWVHSLPPLMHWATSFFFCSFWIGTLSLHPFYGTWESSVVCCAMCRFEVSWFWSMEDYLHAAGKLWSQIHSYVVVSPCRLHPDSSRIECLVLPLTQWDIRCLMWGRHSHRKSFQTECSSCIFRWCAPWDKPKFLLLFQFMKTNSNKLHFIIDIWFLIALVNETCIILFFFEGLWIPYLNKIIYNERCINELCFMHVKTF